MKKTKTNLILVTAASMLLSLTAPATCMTAASKPSLSRKNVHIAVKGKKTIKVRSSVKGTIKVKSLNPYFVSAKRKKKKCKKGSPATFVVKGKCAGYAIIAVTVKLKKAVKKKKTFDLRLNVYVDETPKTTATPSATPTSTPAATATVSPTVSPTVTPGVNTTATPTATMTLSPTATPTATSTVAPTATTTPAATVAPTAIPEDPNNYTVRFTSGVTGDEGVTGMPDPAIVKVPRNGDLKLTLPSAPKRSGYVFDAWIYKNDYLKSPGTVVTVDKDMEIRARWTRVVGAIVDYLPGEAGYENISGLPSGQALGTETSCTLPTTKPSWAGHTFSGWCVQGYDNPIYLPGVTITGIYSNTNFVAQWDRTDGTIISPTDQSSLLPDEAGVYDRLIAMKADFPEGSEFAADREYTLYGGRTINTARGGQAFCFKLFDAAFESTATLRDAKPYTYIDFLSTQGYVGKIGDVIAYNVSTTGWDYKDAIIISTDGDEYTVAEANDGIVHWNTKVPKNKKLEGVYTRWR